MTVQLPRHDPPPPLAGLTVLDLTLALAGPFATFLLAGLGARVIKIENPDLPHPCRPRTRPITRSTSPRSGRRTGCRSSRGVTAAAPGSVRLSPGSCAALSATVLPSTNITSASYAEAGAATGPNTPALPAHCVVRGAMAPLPSNRYFPNRSRPLCPFPAYARYRGEGNMEDAASFVCAEP